MYIHVHTYTLCECMYNASLQVKLLLEWEQTYINYRSLDLPSTINPNQPRGQHGGGQFWWWFVDTVFTLKDDLYDISTIKTLLYPEEVGPEYIGMYDCMRDIRMSEFPSFECLMFSADHVVFHW